MTRLVFRFYKVVLSPAIFLVFNVQCRYQESCSSYTERMVKEQGLFKGSWLGLKRILSCNPFYK